MGVLSRRTLAATVVWLLGSCAEDRKPIKPYHTGPSLPDSDAAVVGDAATPRDGSDATTDAASALADAGAKDAGPSDAAIDASPATSGRDAGVDAASPDGGSDAGAMECHGWTAPDAGRCGGAFCDQTQAQVKTDLLDKESDSMRTAACRTDAEVEAQCSLEAIRDVTTCARTNRADETATRMCSAGLLPQLTMDCLACYVDAARCTAQLCADECTDPDTVTCERCQVAEGCSSMFYRCTGFVDPAPR